MLELTLTDTEFDNVLAGIDQDEDGSVTFQEFRKYFKHAKKKKEEIQTQRKNQSQISESQKQNQSQSEGTILEAKRDDTTNLVQAEEGKSTKLLDGKAAKANAKATTNLKKPRAVFTKYDVNGSDSLDRSEVREAFKSLGCSMKDEDFNQMFEKCDKSHDGSISYKEFKSTL